MALLADRSGDVESNLVGGAASQSKVYTVPANVYVKAESVVATITNGAASAVTPELTIRDQSGVVIARKAQRSTIPAGDSGTATFALRLDDDGAGTPGNQTLAQMILAIPSLSCFWKLNEPSGNVAFDSSGNANDLTATAPFGPPTWASSAGPPGSQTALFLAATDTVRVSSSVADPTPAFTNNFTAGIWARLNSTNGTGEEFMGQETGGLHAGPVGWSLLFVIDKIAVGSVGNLIRADAAFSLGSWYFIVTVRDAGTWKLYINGVQQAATMNFAPGAVTGSNTWIGNDGFAAHTSWLSNTNLSYGFMAGSVVSAADILAMYQAV